VIGLACIAAGVLVAVGLYLLLSAHAHRLALGFLLFSNGINLAVLAAGGLPEDATAPVLGEGAGVPVDPLPQAFVLTAIVIGLGAATFLFTLGARLLRETGQDELRSGERE